MAKPYLIVTSEKVSKEYLDYLDRQNISWIACVKEHVDLARATEILAEQFGVERMSIVGGPKINTAFLEAGLLDEISLLLCICFSFYGIICCFELTHTEIKYNIR